MPRSLGAELLPQLGPTLAKEVLAAMPQAAAEKTLRDLGQDEVVTTMQVGSTCWASKLKHWTAATAACC